MTSARDANLHTPGTIGVGLALFAVTAVSWFIVLRTHSSMIMPGSTPAMTEAVAFTLQWGVMMVAMMLPSALPMILLYRTVSTHLSSNAERAIPASFFAGIYLVVWFLLGVPVYAGYVQVARNPAINSYTPYVVAGVLIAAGLYQFSNVKRVCLRNCEAPLSFLMRRWRSGYRATFRIAVEHAAYCVGCCWALMLILIVAGAMGPIWVLTIAALVFVEKVLPHGLRNARVIGAVLLVLGAAVALRPELSATLRGSVHPTEMVMPDS